MGARLVPSPQARNTLEHLVQSGAIDGDKAVAWKANLKHEEEVKELRAKANKGDADAMYKLGRLAMKLCISNPDLVQARVWFERAAELDHVKGLAQASNYNLSGVGGPSIPALGLVYAARAAEAGSDLAAYVLGNAFLKGTYGLPQSNAQAKRYLGMVAEGKGVHLHLMSSHVEEATQLLQSLVS